MQYPAWQSAAHGPGLPHIVGLDTQLAPPPRARRSRGAAGVGIVTQSDRSGLVKTNIPRNDKTVQCSFFF